MIFSTKRCLINKLCQKDMEDAIELFTDEDVRKYLGGPISPLQADEKLKQWILDKKSLHLCVRLKEANEFIGIISLSPYHITEYKEISYQFLHKFWGYGYATEVIREFLNYCNDVLALTGIVSETQTANEKSCLLLERLEYQLTEKLFRFGEEQSVYAIHF